MHSHLGISFEVWNAGQAWFWLVDDPRCRRGVIGAVADQNGAIREARASIEEMSERRRGANACHRSAVRSQIGAAAIGWKQALANLDRYLTRACANLACTGQ